MTIGENFLSRITDGSPKLYETRIINISSHSKHSGDEVAELSDDDKRIRPFIEKD